MGRYEKGRNRTRTLNGKTLNPGDGIIYVSDVQKAYRIKTGEVAKL
ncbi:MAG: hypothetical protein LC658_01530 [Bacteroidales bacterium]|nr:hypothetical protein [Bacteroidales bacterium]